MIVVLTGLIAEDTWNLVVLSSLNIPRHGHTLVAYNHMRTTIQPIQNSYNQPTEPVGSMKEPSRALPDIFPEKRTS